MQPSRSPDPSHCAQCEMLLTDALDRTLSPEDQVLFDRHLAICPDCSRMFIDAKLGAELSGQAPRRRGPNPRPPCSNGFSPPPAPHELSVTVEHAAEHPTELSGRQQPYSIPATYGTGNVLPFRKRILNALRPQAMTHTLHAASAGDDGGDGLLLDRAHAQPRRAFASPALAPATSSLPASSAASTTPTRGSSVPSTTCALSMSSSRVSAICSATTTPTSSRLLQAHRRPPFRTHPRQTRTTRSPDSRKSSRNRRPHARAPAPAAASARRGHLPQFTASLALPDPSPRPGHEARAIFVTVYSHNLQSDRARGTGMNCANHPERERIAFCQNCGKASLPGVRPHRRDRRLLRALPRGQTRRNSLPSGPAYTASGKVGGVNFNTSSAGGTYTYTDPAGSYTASGTIPPPHGSRSSQSRPRRSARLHSRRRGHVQRAVRQGSRPSDHLRRPCQPCGRPWHLRPLRDRLDPLSGLRGLSDRTRPPRRHSSAQSLRLERSRANASASASRGHQELPVASHRLRSSAPDAPPATPNAAYVPPASSYSSSGRHVGSSGRRFTGSPPTPYSSPYSSPYVATPPAFDPNAAYPAQSLSCGSDLAHRPGSDLPDRQHRPLPWLSRRPPLPVLMIGLGRSGSSSQDDLNRRDSWLTTALRCYRMRLFGALRGSIWVILVGVMFLLVRLPHPLVGTQLALVHHRGRCHDPRRKNVYNPASRPSGLSFCHLPHRLGLELRRSSHAGQLQAAIRPGRALSEHGKSALSSASRPVSPSSG